MNVDCSQPFAVILANGEACSTAISDFYLQQAQHIIVLDGAMHRFKKTGYRADVLLGDFDRNEHHFEELKSVFPNIRIEHFPDQESTDLEKGIHYAIRSGFNQIVILWATGRRSDHGFTNIANLVRYPEHLGIMIRDDYSSIYLLPKNFRQWYPQKTILSLIPIGKVNGITTGNLRYPLNDESLELGFRNGNSNEALEDGIVEIRYESGYLLMMECTD